MKLDVKKVEQGPLLAAKGDVGVGSAGGTTGITVGTGGGGTVAGGGSLSPGGQPQPSVGYECDF